MNPQTKGPVDGVSRRMKVVIIAMLAIILLPATIVSQPLSKIVITVSNMDTEKSVFVSIIVYGASNGYFDFNLVPGDEQAASCPVRAGTHDVRLRYWFAGEESNDQWIWESYTVWLFETEKASFRLNS